jgi:hypothetical protein
MKLILNMAFKIVFKKLLFEKVLPSKERLLGNVSLIQSTKLYSLVIRI